jgi:hypothetical protein
MGGAIVRTVKEEQEFLANNYQPEEEIISIYWCKADIQLAYENIGEYELDETSQNPPALPEEIKDKVWERIQGLEEQYISMDIIEEYVREELDEIEAKQ